MRTTTKKHSSRQREKPVLVKRGHFRQRVDLETTTIYCPCGSGFTWSGLDPRLETWMASHAAHVDDERVEETISAEGRKAGLLP